MAERRAELQPIETERFEAAVGAEAPVDRPVVALNRAPPCALPQRADGSSRSTGTHRRAADRLAQSTIAVRERRDDVERGGWFVELIEPSAPEDRDVDTLERDVVGEVPASADQRRPAGAPRSALEEEPRDVERIDDVGRLQFVQPAPDDAAVAGVEIEASQLAPRRRFMDAGDRCLRPSPRRPFGESRQRERPSLRRIDLLLGEQPRAEFSDVLRPGWGTSRPAPNIPRRTRQQSAPAPASAPKPISASITAAAAATGVRGAARRRRRSAAAA